MFDSSTTRIWYAGVLAALSMCVSGVTEARAALDLHAPEAGISDPVATMAPIDRNCASGQVDVNTASPTQIADGLGIPSRPTVQRIIDGRPWIKAADLVSVPGVGPSALPTLNTKACATPTTLPMATPLACQTDSSAVDLQSATAAVIADNLRLPRTVAAGIVGVRPLSQDLLQIVAPRVPGLSAPTVKRLLADGAVCVTPAPFVFAKVTWRWASEQHGAVVAVAGDSEHALIVPPGVVDGPTGAWGRVRVVADALPRLDAHIHGSWEDEVAVRLPDISDPQGGRPAVIHDTESGQSAFSWGQSVVSEPTGTVVAALASLSEAMEVDLSPLCKSGYDNGSLYCASTSPRDLSLLEILKRSGEYAGTYARFSPEPGKCGGSDRARSSGDVLLTMGCYFEGADAQTATWRFANHTGTSTAGGLLTAFGTVLRRTPKGNNSYETGDVQVDGGNYGLVGKAAARIVVERFGLLLPSTSIAIAKNVGTGPSTFNHSVSLDDLNDMWAAFQLLSLADAGFDVAGVNTYYQIGMLNCFNTLAGSGGAIDLGTIKACLDPQADAFLDGAESAATAAGDTKKASKLAGVKQLLRRATLVLLAEDWAASFIFQAGDAIRGAKDVTLEYLPPPPTVPGGGGLGGIEIFIARTPDRKGYIVDPDSQTAIEIKNGGDFLCYAKSLFVIDLVRSYSDGAATYLNLGSPTLVVDGNAPPCSAPSVFWNYGEPPAGNTPVNVILKGEDDGGVDSAWLINRSGEIQTIPDGGTYECLVLANPVIWNVPLAKINAWRKVGTEPARCG